MDILSGTKYNTSPALPTTCQSSSTVEDLFCSDCKESEIFLVAILSQYSHPCNSYSNLTSYTVKGCSHCYYYRTIILYLLLLRYGITFQQNLPSFYCIINAFRQELLTAIIICCHTLNGCILINVNGCS